MTIRGLRGTPFLTRVNTVTSGATVTVVNEAVVAVNKTVGGATSVVLPNSAHAERLIFVKDAKGDAASNNITITVASAGTIDGAASLVISENYGAVFLGWTGTEWSVLATVNTVSSTEIGFLNGVTAGTAAASKAVVLDANSNVATINGVTTTNATITTATVVSTVTNSLTFGDVGALAATGTVIANAAAITNSVVVVSGADDAKGVILPVTTAGKVFLVYSSQATNGLKVYAPINGAINGGSANAAIVIEGKTLALFLATTTLNYSSMFTVNA